MSEERKRILDMLADGKISAEDAMKLLEEVEAPAPPPVYSPAKQPESAEKMFRVRVVAYGDDNPKPVNVTVNLPLKAARIAGRMIMTMMPREAQDALADKGIDLAGMDIVGLIDALEETGGDIVNVTAEDGEDQVLVRIYVE